MDGGLSSLTEREKEALRLLLAGHDAKSSATALGLSVHTVNERLRGARRKLGVGSSREAARLLAAAEGTPEKIGHEQLGVAGATIGRAAGEGRGQDRPSRRKPGLAVGGILMTAILLASALIWTMAPDDVSRPLPDWSQAPVVPGGPGPINRVHLDGPRLLWNGKAIDETMAAQFLAIVAEMKPQPVTVLSYAARTPAARVHEARRLIGDNLSCTPATCVEVTGALPAR